MSLYDFANGDPVNYFDADGRLATKFKHFIDNFEISLPGIGGSSAQDVANQAVSDAYSNAMYPFDLATAYIDSIEISAPGIGGQYVQDEFNTEIDKAKAAGLTLAAIIDILDIPSGEGLAPALKILNKTDDIPLTPAQLKKLKEFNKKTPSNTPPASVDTLADQVMFTAESPGIVPGSKKVYQKTVDANGVTTSYTKTTVTPDGRIDKVTDALQNPEVIIYRE